MSFLWLSFYTPTSPRQFPGMCKHIANVCANKKNSDSESYSDKKI